MQFYKKFYKQCIKVNFLGKEKFLFPDNKLNLFNEIASIVNKNEQREVAAFCMSIIYRPSALIPNGKYPDMLPIALSNYITTNYPAF
jgi:hypothetical protein